MLDTPGVVDRVQLKEDGEEAGLWISRETYDGVHAETKGKKLEFWIWAEDRKTLALGPVN